MPEIRVIDSIMGSGKTTWALNYMNEHKDRRFIFVTPYVDETKRITQACPHFQMPPDDNSIPKQSYFEQYINDGECIATTHELFKQVSMTERILKKIADYGYTLILDEVIDVVEKLDITESDIDVLDKNQFVSVDTVTKQVTWIKDDYNGRYDTYKRIIKTKTVIKYRDNLLIWVLPPELVKSFRDAFILTFMFPGSYMEQYLLIYGMAYTMHYIQNSSGTFQLMDGKQDIRLLVKSISKKIHIYEGRLNETRGSKEYELSANWWKGKGKEGKLMVENNAVNYIRNVCGASSDEVLWTYIKYLPKYKEPSLRNRFQSGFCPCNARAVNTFRTKTCLVYLVNVFQDPGIRAWFRENGGDVSEEQYALSQLLQWVWRSAIRDGNEVRLYLPSKRMRRMLQKWLSLD